MKIPFTWKHASVIKPCRLTPFAAIRPPRSTLTISCIGMHTLPESYQSKPRTVIQSNHAIRRLFIQAESTPNTHSVKFKPGCDVLGDKAMRTVEIMNASQARKLNSQLAVALFRIEGVESILYGKDSITITKAESVEWPAIQGDIYSEITKYFSGSNDLVNLELLSEPPSDTLVQKNDSEVVVMIKELLESRIRPTIQDDGGDIEYVGFNDESGVVFLKLKGACRTCDSSVVTLKNGIQNMLQYFIPEVKGVEQVLDEVDQINNDAFVKLEDTINRNNTG